MCHFRERKTRGEKKASSFQKVIAVVFIRLRMLPEQRSAAVPGGPANDQLLLPVHVLPGQTVATATQDPGHVKGLMQDQKRA